MGWPKGGLVSNYRTQYRDVLSNNPPRILCDILRKKIGTWQILAHNLRYHGEKSDI